MTHDAARHISREGLAALEFYRDGLGLDTRGGVATEFTATRRVRRSSQTGR
jgi:hypothetical protein